MKLAAASTIQRNLNKYAKQVSMVARSNADGTVTVHDAIMGHDVFRGFRDRAALFIYDEIMTNRRVRAGMSRERAESFVVRD